MLLSKVWVTLRLYHRGGESMGTQTYPRRIRFRSCTVTTSPSLSVRMTLMRVERTSLTRPIHQQSSSRTSTVCPARTCLNWEMRVESGAAGRTLKMLSCVNDSFSLVVPSSSRNCEVVRHATVRQGKQSVGERGKEKHVIHVDFIPPLNTCYARVRIGHRSKQGRNAKIGQAKASHFIVFNFNRFLVDSNDLGRRK